MVITSDEVLFQLKRSILEYGLKHRIDYLVYSWLFSFKKVLISILISDNITFKTDLASDQMIKFSRFKLAPIRFELYNMHILIKNRNYIKFDAIARFLTEFNTIFPKIIPEQLFSRVVGTIKSLVSQTSQCSTQIIYQVEILFNFSTFSNV